MSSSQPSPKKKMTKRGKIALSAFGSVLVAVIGIVAYLMIIIPPPKLCEFKSDSTTDSASDQISVVLAPTSNFVDFDSLVSRAGQDIKSGLGFSLQGEDKKQSLNREFSLVLADSAPKLLVTSFIDPLNGTESQEIETQILSTYGYLDLAAGCAGGYLAKDKDQVDLAKETDLLKALAVASDQLGHTGKKTLYILGNGIQTSGAIRMQDEDSFPKTEARAFAMAKSLEQRGELPDLAGISVKWYGLGQVDGSNQKTLPTAWTKSLKAFWSKTIELSGGTIEGICEACGSGEPMPKAIRVHPIQVSPCPLIVKLYEADGVEFKPDSTSFVSDSQAKAAAESTVAKFKAKGCSSMTVTGYAAAGRSESEYKEEQSSIDKTNAKLTKARAKAFAQLLTTAGFDGDITFVGGGTCGTEWDGNGKASSEQQRLCRRVEVSN